MSAASCARSLPFSAALQYIPEVTGNPGNTQQAGFIVQQAIHPALMQVFQVGNVGNDGRIDAAAAGAIIMPSSGVKPIEVSTTLPSSMAASELPLRKVAGDEPVGHLAQQLRHAAADIPVTGTVEAVAAHPVLLVVL